jgi:hypothetical protein
LQTALNMLCTATGNLACLTVLAANAAATSSGATTHFEIAHATIAGAHGIDTGVAGSDSSINTTGTCQTSTGSSSAAGVNIGGAALANVAKSSESSKACNGQAPVQTASSSVISLGGTGVPLPAPGCANGTPNTQTGIAALLPIICNADNTTQLSAPSGVREALTVLVLQLGNTALAKTVAAASESYAVAPNVAPPNCTDSDKDCGHGPPLTKSCPVDTVDNDGDCDSGNKPPVSKCKDTDKDCKNGQTGSPGSCTVDQQDNDGDCDGSVSPANCTDLDKDCGIGPPGTGSCTNDVVDHDGDCVLPGGGSETGAISGENAGEGGEGNGTATEAGGLPFTGQDILKVALIGLLLAGGGLALGSRTRKKSS